MDDIANFFFCVVVITIIGFGFGIEVAGNHVRTEAVEHGAAHWNIAPNGQTQFIWNTPLTNN